MLMPAFRAAWGHSCVGSSAAHYKEPRDNPCVLAWPPWPGRPQQHGPSKISRLGSEGYLIRKFSRGVVETRSGQLFSLVSSWPSRPVVLHWLPPHSPCLASEFRGRQVRGRQVVTRDMSPSAVTLCGPVRRQRISTIGSDKKKVDHQPRPRSVPLGASRPWPTNVDSTLIKNYTFKTLSITDPAVRTTQSALRRQAPVSKLRSPRQDGVDDSQPRCTQPVSLPRPRWLFLLIYPSQLVIAASPAQASNPIDAHRSVSGLDRILGVRHPLGSRRPQSRG